VNYYSVNSLVALATDAAFNVVSCNETFGGDYLELWLRHEPEPERWFKEMVAHRRIICAALLDKMSDLKSQHRRIAIWGCGAKTLCLLSASMAQVDRLVDYLIDSDPHKHGRHVPGTSLEILSPDVASSVEPEVIFVLALSYRQEIAASIRTKIPSCRSILTLDNNGQIISL
jgi:FlaA1/EpsC-like NDP-sugar epimerase